MKRLFTFSLFLLAFSAIFLQPKPVQAVEKYRLGVPANYTAPAYDRLFDGLTAKGFQRGKNLDVIPIDLTDFQTEAGKESIRQEIAQKCDLFFTAGNQLPILLEIDLQTPLLFISATNQESKLAQTRHNNATGVYRGSLFDIFRRSSQMLPPAARAKMGVIYFRGSKLYTRVPEYIEICRELGIELVVKDYENTDAIEQAMRAFKREGVGGLILFPPATRPGELEELIRWQNELKLPITSQFKEDIEKGLLGGPTMNFDTLIPSLVDYAIKILNGRAPAQLPVKYYDHTYIVNLATAAKLGTDIPVAVVEQAEIVGLGSRTLVEKQEPAPLVPGQYVIGMTETDSFILPLILDSLATKGYVEGKNLRLEPIDIKAAVDPASHEELVRKMAGLDLLFVPGNLIPNLISMPPLLIPVCFIATKETAATIPEKHRGNFTGVIRTSIETMFKKSKRLMGKNGANTHMGMLARSTSNITRLIKRYNKIAAQQGITLDLRTYASLDQIGQAMQELQANNEFVMLFPADIIDEELAEIVRWQNSLKLPVLTQIESHARQGLLGGPVFDTAKLAPKLAEYLTKLLQGRKPATLPPYYFQEKYVLNLKTVQHLGLQLPEDITATADILR